MHAELTAFEIGQELPSLRHVMVVGGTFAEWAAASPAEWEDRVVSLAERGLKAGVPWLTLRTYEAGAESSPPFERWSRTVGTCGVIVDPTGDGRQRFADAMSKIPPAEQINEASVGAALYDPADSEPDLVVILGSSNRLPPSLVWELAYAELVFIDTTWNEFGADHLCDAVADFARRRRRFGGLDTDDTEYLQDG